MTEDERTYSRQSLRSAFQSLFWNVVLTRKQQAKFTLKALADALGINKSYVTRSFTSPPNWQIDKLADMADALGVDLIVEARDRKTGVIYTPSETRQPQSQTQKVETGSRTPDVLEDAGPEKRRVVSIHAVGTA